MGVLTRTRSKELMSSHRLLVRLWLPQTFALTYEDH